MHSAKPPTVPINENTTNGLTAETRVRDPINDAVSKQVRPQIVHESSSIFRYAGATNSAVLDSRSTSVMDVITLMVSAAETTRNEFVLSATEIKIDENRFGLEDRELHSFGLHSLKNAERKSTIRPPDTFSRPVHSHFRLASRMNDSPKVVPISSEHPVDEIETD